MNSFGNSIKKVLQISVLALSFFGATTFGAAAQNSNSNDNKDTGIPYEEYMRRVNDPAYGFSPSVKMCLEMSKKSRVERVFTVGIDYPSIPAVKKDVPAVKRQIEAYLTKENVRHEVFTAPASGDKRRGMAFIYAVDGEIYGPFGLSKLVQTVESAVAKFKKKYPDATLGAVTSPSGLTPSSDDGSQLTLNNE